MADSKKELDSITETVETIGKRNSCRVAGAAGAQTALSQMEGGEEVRDEYVKTVILKGTGFVGGRGRVCKIFETEIDAGTRAKRIKAEFGIGGSGWPIDGLGLHISWRTCLVAPHTLMSCMQNYSIVKVHIAKLRSVRGKGHHQPAIKLL